MAPPVPPLTAPLAVQSFLHCQSVRSGAARSGVRKMIEVHIGRRTILGLLAGVAALAVSGCGIAGDQLPTYRYRLTVEVETPEGLKSGSSVIEVRSGVGGKAAGPMAVYTTQARGEAVTVDLGKRGLMFALLRSGDNVDWAGQAMMIGIVPTPPLDQTRSAKDPWREEIRLRYQALLTMKGRYDLPRKVDINGPRDNYPMLVRFGDIANPRTVERVDPDDLAKSLGPGVKLRRITVQLTDEPVTSGIEKRFSWWNDYRDRHFDGTSTSSEDMTTDKIMSHLSSGDFSTEFNN